MKKFIALIIAVLMAGVLTACLGSINTSRKNKLSIVCTIFPEYDWVKQLLCERADDIDLTLLLNSGVDLHSYQPTAKDIITLSTCDMFIYVGGESDAWVNDTLKEAANKDMIVINLLSVLGDDAKEEEIKEGMAAEGEHDEHGESPEYDEHVWLSLKNAAVLCGAISEKLCVLDAAYAADYKSNTEQYLQKLYELDRQYRETAENSKHKTLIFGDRFPFRYLLDDYDLDYYAAFAGCSAETEASFETVAFLAKKMDELGLTSIITIEGAQHKIAQTVIGNTAGKNQQVLVMDSMQSTTLKDAESGTSYLSIMQENLSVLKSALN